MTKQIGKSRLTIFQLRIWRNKPKKIQRNFLSFFFVFRFSQQEAGTKKKEGGMEF